MMPQLILVGAPGSGKGTQAARLVKELGYKHVSTGDLLRAEIGKGTNLGAKLAEIVNSGQLVDDATVLELLQANIDLRFSYIFDGYPRNLDQAKALDSVVLKGAKSLAVYFEIDLEILVDRIANRRVALKSGQIYNLKTKPPKVAGVCDVSGEPLIQRKDDNEETVRSRMDVFKATIGPVLAHYEEKGMLRRLNALAPADEIYRRLVDCVQSEK